MATAVATVPINKLRPITNNATLIYSPFNANYTHFNALVYNPYHHNSPDMDQRV